MFHEQSYQDLARRRARMRNAALLLAAFAVAVYLLYGALMDQAREQGAVALRNAILGAAHQCSAVEGSYPASLSHLESRYGLSINHSDYAVTYEAYAGNVVPTVVVVPR